MPKIKSNLVAMAASLVVAAVIVSSAVAALVLAGRRVTPLEALTSTLVTASLIFALRDKIAQAMISILAREPEDELDDEYSLDTISMLVDPDESEIDTKVFVLWSLLDEVRKRIAPWIRRLVLAVHVGGTPMYTYPSSALAELAINDVAIDPDSRIQVHVSQYGREESLEVWISARDLALLTGQIRESDENFGEKVVLRSAEAVRALYTISKKMYLAVNPGAPNDLAAYTAYKTLRGLEKAGIIHIPGGLHSVLLPEKTETRKLLRAQIEEEEKMLGEARGKG